MDAVSDKLQRTRWIARYEEESVSTTSYQPLQTSHPPDTVLTIASRVFPVLR
jgi:hypothetical protein